MGGETGTMRGPETEGVSTEAGDLDLLGPGELLARLAGAYRAVDQAVQGALPALEQALAAAAPRWAAGGRLLLVGAGTSGRMAQLQAAECPPTFGTPADRVVALMAGGASAMVRAVEGAEDDAAAGEEAMAALEPGPTDVVFAISASGGAPFVRAALARGRSAGALGIGMANAAGSALLREADLAVTLRTGAEPVAGSTRMLAGSAQKVALDLFTTALMVGAGHVYGQRMVDFLPTNAKVRRRAVVTVRDLAVVSEERAADALEASHWRVKTAVVVAARGLGPGEAGDLLARCAGNLRRALAEAR